VFVLVTEAWVRGVSRSDTSVVDVMGVGEGDPSRGVPTFGADSRDVDLLWLGEVADSDH